MITEWELYWMLKLDDIVFILCAVGIILLFVSIAGFALIYPDTESIVPSIRESARRIIRVCTISLPVGILMIICGLICPTTKQMVMIKVIPAIANSKMAETMKGDAASLYKLGIKTMKEYLKEKTE